MAETIGTAYIQIEPSFQGVNAEISKEMGSAGESGGSSFGSGFAKVLGGTGKMLAGAVAAGGAAIAGIGTAFVSASGDVASYGDNIDKMSQKMGLTAEAYQEWDAVMQHSGTSMESMKSSMKTLANAAETGNKAFEAIGLTQKQIANMSQQELFEATIAGLQNVEDTTQRTYLAGKLLGKGATELGALLNTSAEDTQAMRDRVHELGGVMSEDAVKAAAAYQDQLQDMQTAFSGLSRNLMSEFLPGITTVMSGLTEIFSGNSEAGIGQISEGITQIATKITEALPTLLQVGASILQALGDAIIQNLPTLLTLGIDILQQLSTGLLTAIPTMLPAIIEFVTSLATMIIENLPLLIEAATQIILQLALGIATALPDLIPTIIEVVLTIALYLIENVDLLVDAAIQLILGLANGLIAALPVLIEKAPQIVMALVNAFINNAPKLLVAAYQLIIVLAQGLIKNLPLLLVKAVELMTSLRNKFIETAARFIEVGKYLVEGIKQGVANAWEGFKSWVLELLSGMVDLVKAFFKIGSPSRLMADEIGRWIPAGIAEGIENGMSTLNDAMGAMDADILLGAQVTAGSIPGYSADSMESGADGSLYRLLATYLPQIAQGGNVHVSLEGDARRLFRVLSDEAHKDWQITGQSRLLGY